MTKLLDIDALTDLSRTVKIRGEVYPIADTSVQQMLNALDAADKAEAHKNDPKAILNDVIETVQSLVPSCDGAIIRSLSFKQLTAILDYANAPDEELIANAVATDEAAGDGTGK